MFMMTMSARIVSFLAKERGRAYSWSGFSMAMGCMTTAMITTTISQMRTAGIVGSLQIHIAAGKMIVCHYI